jgi:hypothetical protein
MNFFQIKKEELKIKQQLAELEAKLKNINDEIELVLAKLRNRFSKEIAEKCCRLVEQALEESGVIYNKNDSSLEVPEFGFKCFVKQNNELKEWELCKLLLKLEFKEYLISCIVNVFDEENSRKAVLSLFQTEKNNINEEYFSFEKGDILVEKGGNDEENFLELKLKNLESLRQELDFLRRVIEQKQKILDRLKQYLSSEPRVYFVLGEQVLENLNNLDFSDVKVKIVYRDVFTSCEEVLKKVLGL